MAYPSDYNSKLLSCRVPTESFVKFVGEAQQKKLSTSEYMTFKLFKEDVDTSALEKQISELKAALKASEEKKAEVLKHNADWQKSFNDLKIKHEDLVKRWNAQNQPKPVVAPAAPIKK